MYKFKKVVAISGTDEEQEISLQIDQNLFTHPVYVLFAHIFLDNWDRSISIISVPMI